MRTTIIVLLALCSCMSVSDKTLIHVAEEAGLHDVKPTGLAPLSCGNGDFFLSHFTAKNVNDKQVKGSVCCGWMKSCTVRFD